MLLGIDAKYDVLCPSRRRSLCMKPPALFRKIPVLLLFILCEGFLNSSISLAQDAAIDSRAVEQTVAVAAKSVSQPSSLRVPVGVKMTASSLELANVPLWLVLLLLALGMITIVFAYRRSRRGEPSLLRIVARWSGLVFLVGAFVLAGYWFATWRLEQRAREMVGLVHNAPSNHPLQDPGLIEPRATKDRIVPSNAEPTAPRDNAIRVGSTGASSLSESTPERDKSVLGPGFIWTSLIMAFLLLVGLEFIMLRTRLSGPSRPWFREYEGYRENYLFEQRAWFERESGRLSERERALRAREESLQQREEQIRKEGGRPRE